MHKLIILRGNSGSGKTTTAKALQHKLGYNTMLISQDAVRREMLFVRDGEENKALPLLIELLRYGSRNSKIVILEGILVSKWYRRLFETALELYGEQIYAYYYDIPFEETLRRHATKPNHEDFGEAEMRRWWMHNDYIGIIPEATLSADMSLEHTVGMMLRDIGEIE